MSYILDALRKADAQRERDPARGIHAHSVQLAGASTDGRLSGARWLWLAGSLLLVALLVAGGWYVWHLNAVPPVPSLAAKPSASSPAAANARSARVSDVVPAAAVQPPPAPRIDPKPERVARPQTQLAQNDAAPGGQPRTARGAAAAGGAQGGAPAAPMSAPAAPMPAPEAPAAAVAPGQAVPPAPAPARAATPPTPGLPADAPKIAISGGTYSASPAQRMLIVNGQVFNEGSEVAPGVTIEEIKARSAVLKFKGTRYTIAY